MHGNPLLPGSRPWEKHQAKLRRERENIRKQEHVVDDHPVPINIRYEINFDKMRHHEQIQQKRELKNRFLMNNVAYIMQNPGDTDHILKRPMYPGSSYKQNALKALEKRAKDNMKVVLDFDRCYSDYDHVQMAYEWQENRKKKYMVSRYKEDLWKPIFDKQRRIQNNRGRSLDPFYSFRF